MNFKRLRRKESDEKVRKGESRCKRECVALGFSYNIQL